MRTKKTKYVILGLLNDCPMSCYEIKRIIDIRFGFFWNESYGQLYPELKDLLSFGFVQEIAEAKEQSTRGKVVYSITQKGRDALRQWLEQPAEKESVRFELLLKMYFSKEIDAAHMIRHINEFAEAHSKQLDMLNLFQQELSHCEDPSGDHKDILQVIAFGQKVYHAYLDWSKETMAYLERRASYASKE